MTIADNMEKSLSDTSIKSSGSTGSLGSYSRGQRGRYKRDVDQDMPIAATVPELIKKLNGNKVIEKV